MPAGILAGVVTAMSPPLPFAFDAHTQDRRIVQPQTPSASLPLMASRRSAVRTTAPDSNSGRSRTAAAASASARPSRKRVGRGCKALARRHARRRIESQERRNSSREHGAGEQSGFSVLTRTASPPLDPLEAIELAQQRIGEKDVSKILRIDPKGLLSLAKLGGCVLGSPRLC